METGVQTGIQTGSEEEEGGAGVVTPFAQLSSSNSSEGTARRLRARGMC